VSSARAYEIQREEAWVTTVMLQVAEATSRAESMGDVLGATVRVTAMLAGAASCVTWLWSEDREAFEFGAAYGLRSERGGELDLLTAMRLPPASGLPWIGCATRRKR